MWAAWPCGASSLFRFLFPRRTHIRPQAWIVGRCGLWPWDWTDGSPRAVATKGHTAAGRMGSRRQQAARVGVGFFWDSTTAGAMEWGAHGGLAAWGLSGPVGLRAAPLIVGLCWCWVGMGVTRSSRRPGGGYGRFDPHSPPILRPRLTHPYAYMHTRHDDRQPGVRRRRGQRAGQQQHWSSSSEATRPWYVAWFFMHTSDAPVCVC